MEEHKLKKIEIQLARGIKRLDLASDYDFFVVEDIEILLFFANLNYDKPYQAEIFQCIDQHNSIQDIRSYFFKTYNQLSLFCGNLFAKIIMMDTVNMFLSHPSSIEDTQRAIYLLHDNLMNLIIDANSYADFITELLENTYTIGSNYNDSDYFYSVALEHFDGFKSRITYGVYPGFVDGSLYFFDMFTIENSKDCILLDIIQIVKENKIMKKCANCDKFFLPQNRSDEVYCNNKYKDDKTCRQIGYKIKVSNNEFLSAYRTAYKTQHAKMKRKTENMDEENKRKYKASIFDVWVNHAKMKLEESQKGVITIDEFKKWLKQ